MIRKEVAATTTVTDTEQGLFDAIVSGWQADREKDTIAEHAFDKTIAAWRASGKTIPMLLNHTTESVGVFHPASMGATAEGLIASGFVDRSTPNGKQAWRQIKDGSAGFSIGFAGKGVPNQLGGTHWTEIDLLEISHTSTPMNAVTRALNWKAAAAPPAVTPRSERELRARCAAAGVELTPTRLETKRRAQDAILTIASGIGERDRRALVKTAEAERMENEAAHRELRRRSDRAIAEAKTGLDFGSALGDARLERRHEAEAKVIRTKARDDMLLLMGAAA